MRRRIMYIESKTESLNGPARIGWVTFSRTLVSLYYKTQCFQRTKGYKYNYLEIGTGDRYWISGPRKDGEDRLYASNLPVHIDEDAREEYWNIRKRPDLVHQKHT